MRTLLSVLFAVCLWGGSAFAAGQEDSRFTCGDYDIVVERALDAGPGEVTVMIRKDEAGVERIEADEDYAWFVGSQCRDLTGDGHPDLVLTSWTRGAHCCVSIQVLGLGPKLTRYRPYPVGNGDPSEPDNWFEEVEGRPVLMAYDDSFAYWGSLSFAQSPMPAVWGRFDGMGWRMDIDLQRQMPPAPIDEAAMREELRNLLKSPEAETDALPGILSATLDLIYTGQADKAWALIEALKPDAGKPDLLPDPEKIKEQLLQSPHCRALVRMNGVAMAGMPGCTAP